MMLMLATATASVAGAQSILSAASAVSIRVTVLPRVSPAQSVEVVSHVARRERDHVDFTSSISVASSSASRIMVRLPKYFGEDAGQAGLRISVRGADGEYHQVVEGGLLEIGAVDAGEAVRVHEVDVRVEADDPALLQGLNFPLTYQLASRRDSMSAIRVTAQLTIPSAAPVTLAVATP
jgi:hypothetical protein